MASFSCFLSEVQERRVGQCGATLSYETQTQPMITSLTSGRLGFPRFVSLMAHARSHTFLEASRCDGNTHWATHTINK